VFDSFKKLWSTGQASSTWRMTRLWARDSTHIVGLALLRLVAVAHAQQLDLAPLVRLLSTEHRGLARRRLVRLANLLEQGTPFVEAIEQQPFLLTDEQVLEIRLAHQSGTTTQTLQELIQRSSERSRESANQILQALTYAMGLTVAVALILTFLTLFISPTYKQMFEDFGLRLPLSLRYLMWWSTSIGRNLPLIALAVALLAAIVWYFRPLRTLQRWISVRVTRSAVQLQLSQLLRMLARSIEAGRPLPGTLSTLARYHFDRRAQIKLLFARNEVEQGYGIWHSLARAKLLDDQEAQAVEKAATDSLRAWLIRKMAAEKEETVRLHRAFLSMLVHPALILGFGCLVVWICVAYFSVLITMITALG
jgi:type II secretory pathway component PulF